MTVGGGTSICVSFINACIFRTLFELKLICVFTQMSFKS